MPTNKQGSTRSRADAEGSCNRWYVERCVIALIAYDCHNRLFDKMQNLGGEFKATWKETTEEVNKKMRITKHGPFNPSQVNSAVHNTLEFAFDSNSRSRRRPKMEEEYPLMNDVSMRYLTKKIIIERCFIKCKGDVMAGQWIKSTLHDDFLEDSGVGTILDVCDVHFVVFLTHVLLLRTSKRGQRLMKGKSKKAGCKHLQLFEANLPPATKNLAIRTTAYTRKFTSSWWTAP